MLRRNAAPAIDAALGDTPAVLLHGGRQTGKTTLAKTFTSSGRRYITFDDPTSLAAAKSDPTGFLASLTGPVILDEVQRAPELFLPLKASIDHDRTPGRFLLTGSANVFLLPQLAESLVGRLEVVPLWPLSQGEIEGRRERFIDAVFGSALPPIEDAGTSQPVLERVIRGGFPEPYARADPDRRNAWFASYIATVLSRDVRDMANISGLSDLPRLLAMLASRASGLLNFADLSRSLSLPQTTLKRYFALLEATFLVHTLPAWSSNIGLRLSKAPKVVLSDTGLAAHLQGLDISSLRTNATAKGSLLENFVALELLKQGVWNRLNTRLYHFRSHAGAEVDLVLEDSGGRVVGIEVKSAASVDESDFRGMRALASALGSKFVRGIVLYTGKEAVSFSPALAALPMHALWSFTEV